MTNKAQNKQLAEDQAFIDSLYENLSSDSDDAEQTSGQLDQRILAAAHKAVGSKPVLSKTLPNKKNKKWFFPIATAASAILMITLVGHQIYSPVSDKFKMPTAVQLNTPVLENNSSMQVSREMAQMDVIILGDILAKELHSSNEEELVSQGTILAKKSRPSSLAEMQDKQQTQQRKVKRRTAKLSNLQEQAKFEMLESAKIKSVINSINTPTKLTEDAYLTLKHQSEQRPLYWTLVHENDVSYVIELKQIKGGNTFYRLAKSDFTLGTVSTTEQILFTEIKLKLKSF